MNALPMMSPAGTQYIEADLDSLHQGRGFLYGPHKVLPYGKTSIFDCFESSGQNTVCTNQLTAHPIGRLGKYLIHLLRLSSGQIDNLRSVLDQVRELKRAIGGGESPRQDKGGAARPVNYGKARKSRSSGRRQVPF